MLAVRARQIVTPAPRAALERQVERFMQTRVREQAYVRTESSSSERARTLLSFVRFPAFAASRECYI